MYKHSFKLALVGIAAILAATGCEKSTPPRHADDGEIVFAAQGLNFNVQTKATPVTELATFNVLASTGTVGASETQTWTPVAVTKDGSDYLTGKYWPLTDQSYHFYASNASLTFGATGSTVTADGSTDIVVAYLPTPSFKEKNTLTFNHIYARVGNLTLNTQSGYTLSGVSATLKDGVSGGTYNIFSGNGQTDGTGWSALSAASDRALGAFSSSTTAPVSSNDLWLVPGDYTISVTYTLNKGDYSEQFTKTGTVSLVAGKTNNITATAVGGSASEIKFGVSVTAWNTNSMEMEWDNYLTFEAQGTGNIVWKLYDPNDLGSAKTIQYRKNRGAWTDITATTEGAEIAVSLGDVVEFKGDNESYYYTDDYESWNYFSATIPCYVYGNVNTLLRNKTITELCFSGLFYNRNTGENPHILNHPSKKIELPATTLAENCYQYMFKGCTSLTSAPKLPATTLANACYFDMFEGCTSLTSAPELSATTLANFCYESMFKGCTSLTSAPELPATTLASYCYESMFYGCTSLTSAPELPATTLASYCYESMFYGCTSLTSAPELPATTLTNFCYQSMFYGCTSLTSAPELPATTLAKNCYQYMFKGCTSLTSAPELSAITLANYCYSGMFEGCTSLNYIKCLATSLSASNALYNWVISVASSGTFVKKSGVTWPSGTSGIPSSWTVQEI